MSRHSSYLDTSSSSAQEHETTSKLALHHLPDNAPVFACHKCSEVIVSSLPVLCGQRRVTTNGVQALQDELVSKAFNGRSGRA